MNVRLAESHRKLLGAALVAAAVCLSIALLHRPMFTRMDTWGGHDWDAATLFRYFVVKSVKQFHTLPFWNPWTCGGHDAWSYVESDATVVSPFVLLPFLVDLRLAIRIEVLVLAWFGALGTWKLAGRVTESHAARALAALLFAANQRWAEQAAVGHVWHLYYAYVPWSLLFFWRAISPGLTLYARAIESVKAAIMLALMVYAGALYPLPHTCLAMGMLALFEVVRHRTLLPVRVGAAIAVISVGFAALKLFPLLQLFSRSPRHVDSPETFLPQMMWHALTDTTPLVTGNWGWHEYGMYIGVPLTLLLGFALVRARADVHAWRIIALVFLILAAGNFHDLSPWNLLHKLPVFRSQHVPSRFLYVALLAASLTACAWFESLRKRLPKLEWAAMALLVWTCFDLVQTNRASLSEAFILEMQPVRVRREFVQEMYVPVDLYYKQRAWSIPALPAAMSNVGIVECTAVGPVCIEAPKDASGHIIGRGALGRTSSGYRGEHFTLSGQGRTELVRFTPNEIVVRVVDGVAGDLLVLNQNFDPGWRAQGTRVVRQDDRTAAVLHGGTEEIRFKFRPHLIEVGVIVFLATVLLVALALKRLKPPTPRVQLAVQAS